MTRLVPKEITITSSAKHFGLDRGASDGSELSISFCVPDELSTDRLAFAAAVLEEKERLDRTVLYMEYAKGAIDEGFLQKRRQLLQARYDKLLKRTPQTPVTPLPPDPQAEMPTEEVDEG